MNLQLHHIIVSHRYDLNVWFSDISQQLLTSSSPLRFEYPQPLPHLTINIGSILQEPTLGSTFSRGLGAISVQSVALAADSLECLIVLNIGVVLAYRFVEGGKPDPRTLDDFSVELDGPQSIVVPLSDLGKVSRDAFQPVCLLDASRGRVTQLAVSDVGRSRLAENVAYRCHCLGLFCFYLHRISRCGICGWVTRYS
jgi:hypothetical protein